MESRGQHSHLTYRLRLKDATTVRGITGPPMYLSTAEVFPGVEIVQCIQATECSPALIEVTITLDGERRVLILRSEIASLERETR